jgi:hypothetical protein
MTTTKDYIRQTAWFTSNGLPDPRLEGREAAPTPWLSTSVNAYMDRFKKLLAPLRMNVKQKENFQ